MQRMEPRSLTGRGAAVQPGHDRPQQSINDQPRAPTASAPSTCSTVPAASASASETGRGKPIRMARHRRAPPCFTCTPSCLSGTSGDRSRCGRQCMSRPRAHGCSRWPGSRLRSPGRPATSLTPRLDEGDATGADGERGARLLSALGRQLGEHVRLAPAHHDAGRQDTVQLLQVARACARRASAAADGAVLARAPDP